MPRNTSHDAYFAQLNVRRCQWHDLHTFGEIINQTLADLGDVVVVHVKAKPWREAWVALCVATKIIASRARCSDDDPPDVLLEIPTGIYKLEVTEIQECGRRRDEEYKKIQSGELSLNVAGDITEKQVELTPSHVVSEIRRLSLRKAPKLEGKDCNMAFYFNTHLNPTFNDDFFTTISEAASVIAGVCNDVWVVNGTTAYLMWQNQVQLNIELPQQPSCKVTPLNEILRN